MRAPLGAGVRLRRGEATDDERAPRERTTRDGESMSKRAVDPPWWIVPMLPGWSCTDWEWLARMVCAEAIGDFAGPPASFAPKTYLDFAQDVLILSGMMRTLLGCSPDDAKKTRLESAVQTWAQAFLDVQTQAPWFPDDFQIGIDRAEIRGDSTSLAWWGPWSTGRS